MTRRLNGARREISRLYPGKSNVCTSCRQNLLRNYATSTATTTSGDNTEQILFASHKSPVQTSTAPHRAFDIRAGVVLSRPPLITRDLTAFEKAFYLYQRRLNERTALPFTRYFYFQPNTPAEVDWKRKIKERKTAAREIGIYDAYGKHAHADEVRVGAKESEPDVQMEALLQDAVVEDEANEEKGIPGAGALASKDSKTFERPMPRLTEADETGDTRSLNRALARTLYLVVKNKEGEWQFPSDLLVRPESLHRAAERLLIQSAGLNMNTWLVGNAPVGHHIHQFEDAAKESETKNEVAGQKTFFMKARILGGKPELKGNKLGLADYRWLAKDELESEVSPLYWKAVRNILVEQ